VIQNKNNFDLLRILFAGTVFLVHAATLTSNEYLISLLGFLSSDVAVKSFFIVSGFLIFMSYENSQNISSYFLKRVRRIYPAYFVVIVSCVLIGAYFSSFSWHDYWSLSTLKYLISNLTFLNFLYPTLPGLFANNPNETVNGALWTLKIEVMFYLTVPIMVFLFNRVGRLSSMIGLFLFSILYSSILLGLNVIYDADYLVELQRQLPGQLTFFMVGAAGYYYSKFFKKYSNYFLFLALLILVLRGYFPWLLFESIVLGILVMYLALIFPYLGHFSKYGDFSYGIYILHFPILQLFVSNQLFKDSPIIFVSTSGLTVLFCSILLWRFVEKPFLKKNSHYAAQ
jgi:peptidoglycan/LPS O-acetylase OafA/YrhL